MSLRTETRRDGRVERIVLSRPRANLLDREMVAAVREHLATLDRPELQLVVFEGEGAHFSFGASVEEHLPGRVEQMLPELHALFRELEALGVPTAAVVRGQCLGGGMELAIACGWIFCDDSARFAVPEVRLGVFPPIAALLLPFRVGTRRATGLVVSGRSVSGAEAVECGLVDACVADPEARLMAWFDAELAPLSAVAVRAAWRASRAEVRRALDERLPGLERQYLDELMACRDPIEGLSAFVERRPPVWRHA